MRQRRECPEIGWGEWRVLDVEQPSVLAHSCDWEGSAVLALHNLSEESRMVRLDEGDLEGLDDVFSDGEYAPPEAETPEVELEGYGYRWFRIRRSAP